jgi:molybdate transport system substrate-binding protein
MLVDPSIRRIAMANPRTAPYGKAALEALEKSGIYQRIASKMVMGESIAQTFNYALHTTDAALLSASSMHAPASKRFKKGVHWIPVDPALYRPIAQGSVLLKHGQYIRTCQSFYRWLFSPEAQTIFRQYDYLLP